MAELREIRVHTDPAAIGRTETLLGREYYVVPLVALQEGVIQGANAANPEYCPALELQRTAAGWNGRPLVMNHPQIQGVFVSANHPTVLADWSFGYIFNTYYDDTTTKLKQEAWVDVARANELGGEFLSTLTRLQAGQMVEISTGLFCDVMPTSGSFRGQAYKGTWANVVSDHLALLSEGTLGACSIEAGCGAPRLNQVSNEVNEARGQIRLNEAALRTIQTSNCDCGGSCGHCGTKTNMLDAATLAKVHADIETNLGIKKDQIGQIFVNTSIRDSTVEGKVKAQAVAGNVTMPNAMSILDDAIEVKFCSGTDAKFNYCYLIDATSAVAVFRGYDANYDGGTYQISYNMDGQGNVQFSGDVTPVVLLTQIFPKPKVNVVNVGAANPASTVGATSDITDQGKGAAKTLAPLDDGDSPGTVCTDDKDNEDPAMTTNTATATTAASTVGTATDQLDEDKNVAQPPGKQGSPSMAEPTNNAAGGAAAAPLNVQQFLESAPPEMREMLESGLRMQAQRREALTGAIKANKANKFSDEQLKAFSLDVLENMAALAVQPAGPAVNLGLQAQDFSGRANAGQTAVTTEGGAGEIKVHEDQTTFGAPKTTRYLAGRAADAQPSRVGTFRN